MTLSSWLEHSQDVVECVLDKYPKLWLVLRKTHENWVFLHKNYSIYRIDVTTYLKIWVSLHWKLYSSTLTSTSAKQNSAVALFYMYFLWHSHWPRTQKWNTTREIINKFNVQNLQQSSHCYFFKILTMHPILAIRYCGPKASRYL